MANETKQRDIRAEINLDGPTHGELKLTFADGQTLAIRAGQLAPEIATMAMFHGLKQKLVDAAALPRDTSTGRSATVAEKYAAVKAVYDRLFAGLWNEPREGGGGASILLRALCRVYPKRSTEELREWLSKRTDAEKAALRQNQKIKDAIAAIEAEKAATTGVDSDSLLDELDAD